MSYGGKYLHFLSVSRLVFTCETGSLLDFCFLSVLCINSREILFESSVLIVLLEQYNVSVCKCYLFLFFEVYGFNLLPFHRHLRFLASFWDAL